MASEDGKDVLMDAGSSDMEAKVAGDDELGQSSSDSDNSDAEDDKGSEELLEQLQAAVNASPGNYEAHVQVSMDNSHNFCHGLLRSC